MSTRTSDYPEMSQLVRRHTLVLGHVCHTQLLQRHQFLLRRDGGRWRLRNGRLFFRYEAQGPLVGGMFGPQVRKHLFKRLVPPLFRRPGQWQRQFMAPHLLFRGKIRDQDVYCCVVTFHPDEESQLVPSLCCVPVKGLRHPGRSVGQSKGGWADALPRVFLLLLFFSINPRGIFAQFFSSSWSSSFFSVPVDWMSTPSSKVSSCSNSWLTQLQQSRVHWRATNPLARVTVERMRDAAQQPLAHVESCVCVLKSLGVFSRFSPPSLASHQATFTWKSSTLHTASPSFCPK